MSILPPSPFFNSGVTDCSSDEAATALRQESVAVDIQSLQETTDRFSIDEDSFLYAIDPPPIEQDNIEAVEIEQVLRALFASNQ